MALRSSDDLNQLICDKLAETGSLTSDELFSLAKPYYELTDSKSELSQWARARIANLRKKRKVWPTAHMVYGTGKGKLATGDFESLKNQIPPHKFYESPRTVYWSWEFGMSKHDFDGIEDDHGDQNGAPDHHLASDNEAAMNSDPGECTEDDESPFPEPIPRYNNPRDDDDEDGDDEQVSSPMRLVAAVAAAAAAADTAQMQQLPRQHGGSGGGNVFFPSPGRGAADDTVSPTREIRGSLFGTHISSPKRKSMSEAPLGSPSKRRTSSSVSEAMPGSPMSKGATGGGNNNGYHHQDHGHMNSTVDGDVWEDERQQHSPASSHSNHEGSDKLLLLAAAAQLELPPSSASSEVSPPRNGTPGRSPRGRKGTSKSSSSGSGKKKNSRTASASPRRGSSGAARGSGAKYKCGKCGFFPKSTPHSCKTGMARTGKASQQSSPERSRSTSPNKTTDSPRYQSRPKQYACGKCGFFPKSTAHSCKTASAVDPAQAASPRRKSYSRAPNPSTPSGEGRPRQYRCGKCGFFPKAKRHDCETGKEYPSDSDSPAAKDAPASAAKVASRKSRQAGGAGGVDLAFASDMASEAAAASILSMATSTPTRS
eukprot:m.67029 g.67029  ORF g.67029 m.67029 type:complete len:597 (-) comp8404_c0_seq3:392-2182(-)